MTLKQLCFSCKGRINRRIYWSCVVPLYATFAFFSISVHSDAILGVVVGFPLVGYPIILGVILDNEGPIGLIVGPILLLWFYVSLAATVKRLHDTNRSGWHVLIGLIPVIGTLYLSTCGLIKGTEGVNDYGLSVDRIT